MLNAISSSSIAMSGYHSTVNQMSTRFYMMYKNKHSEYKYESGKKTFLQILMPLLGI